MGEGRKQILLVEPNRRNSQRYATALTAAGFTVMNVDTAEEAHRIHQTADLVICRAALGGMNGFELAVKLGRACGARVLLISRFQRELLRYARSWRAQVTILEEPFTPDELAGHARQELGI